MITPYLAQQPVDDFGFNFSKLIFNALVPGGSQEPIIIPSFARRYKAIMSTPSLGAILVSVNDLVIPPSSPTFVLSNAESLPLFGSLCREVKSGDTLYFYNSGTDPTLVQVVFYSIGQNN
jgi:hypothetical protein